MEFNTLIFEEPEPGIALLTLNRPDRLNAMSMEMLDELYALYDHLKKQEEIRVLVVTGAGRGFCSGADLIARKDSEGTDLGPSNAVQHLEKIQKVYSGVITGMRNLSQPVISAVNGVAAGGGFCLALAADVIYAGTEAKFIPSFINIGLSGGELGTTYFLPKLVGSTRAAEILMTGKTVDAVEADRIGMVCRIVETEKLVEAAMDTARTMIGKSTVGLRLTKQSFNQNLNAPSLENAIELENLTQSMLIFTPEFMEAVTNFSKGKNARKSTP
ncbi:MAG: enoyl-CoA hydratase/isomerase family protein [Proteobacteria bacterium]|nr:enoyl-CoA hydratase/isomerase family protein [Pseudomonadota bacterium]